jgi:NADPH2:quinone reductase
MRAVWLTEFGPPEVLVAGEAPDPRPGAAQALVQVAVSGITFTETRMRAGRWPGAGDPPRPPLILGNGVGGVVTAVASGVDPRWSAAGSA